MTMTLRQTTALAGLALVLLAIPTANAAPAISTPGRGKVVAVDKQTGRPAWEATLWSQPETALPPLVTPELVYVLEDGKLLKALDAGTGKPRWQTLVVTRIPLSLAGELVIAVSADAVHAFNRWTGKQIWQFSPALFPEWKLDDHSVPVIASNRLLLPAGNTIIALDPNTGQPTWAYTVTAAKLPLQPAVVGDMVYLPAGPNEAEIRLKLEDGLPDTGEYALPADVARAIARQRKQQAKPPAVVRPAGSIAKKPFIAVRTKVAPGGKVLAAAGAKRWSFTAPAGWTIDRVAGESADRLFALIGSTAPVASGKRPTP